MQNVTVVRTSKEATSAQAIRKQISKRPEMLNSAPNNFNE